MCSGIFQSFILHITCMRLAATLAKPKHVGNEFADLNLFRQNVYVTVYVSSTFTNITLRFISITFIVPYWSNVFFFFHIPFFKSKYNIFCFLLISMLRMSNLFLAFKNENCRVFHERAFEFTDWLIWLVNQFWLVHLNKHQLVEILLTASNCYQL